MINICDENKCTGCRACIQICPQQSIRMQVNQYGVSLPVIDAHKCIDCGLCQKVCQVISKTAMNQPKKCYAIWTKNLDDRRACSSGGLAMGFARKIIEMGGIVFGAGYTDNLELKIMDAHTVEGAELFRGSKYVQCDTGSSYSQVRSYLSDGKKVLFVGTPCQIMGLRKFLQKEYDNLLTVDIICHGVPPFIYLQEHIANLHPERKVTKVTFRGENDYKLTLYNGENIIYCKERYLDAYFTAFLEGLIFRENCYSCQFACESRTSDITIGDFWGLKRDEMTQQYNGKISTMLINTEKGADFFNAVKETFFYEERPISEAIAGNEQLKHAAVRLPKRDVFLSSYSQKGLERAFVDAGIQKFIKHNKSLWYKMFRKGLKMIKIVK